MQNLKSRLDRHFVACSAAAAAAVVGGGVVESAEASIVYSGVVNHPIASTINGLYLNVVTGQINEPGNTGGSTVPGWDVNPYSSTSLIMFNPAAPAGGVYVTGGGTGTAPGNLPVGQLISGASTFGQGTVPTTGLLPFVLNSSSNIVGFRFQNEANANQTHYGWMRISLAGTLAGQPRMLVEYAYENVAGVGIGAGIIPTPGSLALLALGAAGLAGRRRR